MTLSIRTILAGAVLIAAGAVVVGGFLVVGSPTEARLRRLDDRRVSDLRTAVGSVNVFWTRKHELPGSLDDARKESGVSAPWADPVTEQPYEYRVLREKGREFELCTTFDRASERGPSSYPGDPFWSHGSGRQCFTIAAKDLSKNQGR